MEVISRWNNYSKVEYVGFESLLGKTLKEVHRVGDEALIFITNDGEKYQMYHEQDCCESVEIEDICGELDDLIGEPILIAREDTKEGEQDPDGWGDDSSTWTFYNIATIKGSLTIRWFGSSNGYYSESVELIKIKEKE
jgi:hypothetical protein